MYRVALRVTGVDLDNDATLGALFEVLDDLTWMEIDGRTLAVLHTDGDPVASAVLAARQITAGLPGAKVEEVDQDLVGISDIAKRIGVTREAVRLWVDGRRGPGGFPPPVGSAGGGERGSVRFWRWASVSDWLRKYNLHDEEDALSAVQVAEVNAALLRVMTPMDFAWQEVSKGPLRIAQLKSSAANIASPGCGHTVLTFHYSAATAWHERLAAALASGDEHERDDDPAFR
ncbi:hypothetical protein [Micromonospora violae]|uniref:hypothetical protein n=1 Tax=Micromonospora violae TaxID=1278207 RepID=UPI0033E858E9